MIRSACKIVVFAVCVPLPVFSPPAAGADLGATLPRATESAARIAPNMTGVWEGITLIAPYGGTILVSVLHVGPVGTFVASGTLDEDLSTFTLAGDFTVTGNRLVGSGQAEGLSDAPFTFKGKVNARGTRLKWRIVMQDRSRFNVKVVPCEPVKCTPRAAR